MVKISLIVAHDQDGGIGKDNQIPWHCSFDLKKFKKVTVGKHNRETYGQNAIIMGRKTWESLPDVAKPLKDRINIVVSTKTDYQLPEGAFLANSLEDAISTATKNNSHEIFIIGGASLYKESMEKKICDTIYITRIPGSYDCDTFIPDILWLGSSLQHYKPDHYYIDSELSDYAEISFQKDDNIVKKSGFVSRKLFKFNNPEETQYLDLVKKIFNNGVLKPNRTGVDTLSLFGETMRFSLRDGRIPLLTTKRVYWKGVVEELLWFISGSTNSNELSEKGVSIWDANGSREFLDSRGLTHREEGDLGPVYGYQWRHFNAEYKTMHDNYDGQGVDQIQNIIETLKTDPYSRRMILTAWNPSALKDMALPPCHLTSIFYVTPKEDGPDELSCQMLQRSCDVGLGVPFNIASYSLLVHMIAKCVGMVPGEFMHILCDAHIYVNHIDALKEQIKRSPRAFPTLKINTDNTDINSFKYEDFELVNYRPYKNVKMKMAV